MNVKAIWKFAFVMLLAIGGLFSVSHHTEAAAKPYEYTFVKDTGVKFNGIGSINALKITFDKDVSALKSLQNNMTVLQNNQPVNIIRSISTSADDYTLQSNELLITFKNLDLIDYTADLDYKLVIEKETLRFDQLDKYEIPFKIYDLLPGFKSTFIDTDSTTINNNIFKTNAPRDVMVHVPKLFISSIETIHHYTGILPNPLPNSDTSLIKDPYNDKTPLHPKLTNIDVLAEKEAARLKVTFKNTSEYSRDLLRRTDIQGFSMGQAGIDDITNYQMQSLNEFQLRAFDDNGRFLEQRNFKLKVTDPKTDYVISDYLPKPTDEFGKTYSLYELMADQTLLEDIITRIPVSELDSLGITYAVGNPSVSVYNEEQLRTALANPNVTSIALKDNISLTGATPLQVNRSLTIEGSNYTLNGNITLGSGQDMNVRVNNLNIVGNLTVDVGVNGTAILDSVKVMGTPTILSGGVNSVHLQNFYTPASLILNNSSALRVVTNSPVNVNIVGTAPVTLEGSYGYINVQSGITLNLKKLTSIGDIYLNFNTGQMKIVTSEPMDHINLDGSGIVTVEGEYLAALVKNNITLNATKNTIIHHIEVLDGKTLTLTGTAENITSINGKAIFPSGITISSINALASAAADADQVVVAFDRNVFKTPNRVPLNAGTNAIDGDFDDYFTVKKGNTELNVKASYPYSVVNAGFDVNTNTTFSILLNSDIKIGDVLTVGLKPGKTLYDLNGKPITGATMNVVVTSADNTFLPPTATIANNKITLQFAELLDASTVATSGLDFLVNNYSVLGAATNGDKIELTLDRAPAPLETVTIRMPYGTIQDKVGNRLPGYTVIATAP